MLILKSAFIFLVLMIALTLGVLVCATIGGSLMAYSFLALISAMSVLRFFVKKRM